ncbi:class A beta-lactamase [Lysinibacter sp. HNR]|uniref:class A beta-lactamase n=1 Tax=Lysinibacter sp. HNR TaxID=3031408 RepID=UPI0024359892|nr:class A beta-lactamase [Lysinibacter sp. HNR]WGD36202.1 class A beta-lactamase [Lysinibacter sp. HNR]
MTNHMTRRTALSLALSIPLVGCAATTPSRNTRGSGTQQSEEESPAPGTDKKFRQLEQQYEARLGVYAVDTGSRKSIEFQADERFAYCSTFKAIAAAEVVRQREIASLEEVIRYAAEDLVEHSPITEQHLATGMTIRELCDATVRYSDNAAINLLLRSILGGPKGLESALRTLGDNTTQMERYELELNTAIPGEVRDTTTPRAWAQTLREYALGTALSEEKKVIFVDWLVRNTTGDELIRAGVPQGWKVGDKTGGGDYGTRNDIGIVWPPDSQPIVLAVLSSRATQDATFNNALIADATRVAISAIRQL